METDVSTALATLQIDPDNAQALTALKGLKPGNGAGVDPEALARALADARRWHRERGDFELCVQLIDLELPWTTDKARRADLLHEKGRVLADELLRDDAAQACFREALENVPGHAASTEDLSQMALIAGNWQPIAARYLKQAEAATDPAMGSSLFGSVAEMYLKNRPDAPEGETYLRRSLQLDPKNRRASQHLERMLRARNRPDEVLALLGTRASQAQGREERAQAEIAVAELSQKLGKSDEAFAHFRKALEASPGEAKALRPVVAALTEKKDWPELAKVLELSSRSKRGEADVPLLMQLGTLLWKKLNQIPQAEIQFRKVRKLDPSNRAMVEFYREFHGQRDELPQLLVVLTAAQKAETDIDRQVAIGIEMAKVAEARPQNAEKIIDIWKGLLRLKPHLPEAVESLRRLYVKTQKWNALLDLLKDDLEALPETSIPERIGRTLEIAEIYRDRLNLEVMVVNTYLAVLQLDPRHPQALGALESRYEAQSRWSDLIHILGRQAQNAPDGADRIKLHRRVASLWMDKLGKHQNAVPSLEKILEADPTDAEARTRLRDIYTRGRSWRALVDLTRREASLLPVAERRSRLTEAARIVAERLGDTKEAINVWNLVLAIDEHDVDALGGLAALYERERRWAGLAEILDRQRKAVAKDPTAEAPLLERRGVLLYEKLGAPEAAIAVFQRLQELQPQNARANRALREIYAQSGDFEALERLFAGQGNYEDLCDTLTMLADRSPDATARTRMLERVAVLASEKLQQPERALKAYERILAADPGNLRAAEALVPLYRGAQKWPRLLATYEILLGKGDGKGAPRATKMDTAAELAILKDARQIAEQRMGSKGLAFQWAARCFDLAPTDQGIQTDLERLAGEADEWDVVAALYAKRLETLTGPNDSTERRAFLRRSLRIASAKLHRPVEARTLAETLLAEDPTDTDAQAALEQILIQTQAWPDLATLLHGRAGRISEVTERTKLLFRIAQIEEEKAGNLAAAAATLRQIVDLDAGSETGLRAMRALARILEAQQDWPGLIEALRRELEIRPTQNLDDGHTDLHEDLLLRIGEIEETRVGDLDATFATYRDVLAANPLSAAAVAGLERVAAGSAARKAEIASLVLPFYQRTDNAAKLAAALEVLASAAASPEEKIPRIERLIALYAGPLKNPQGAYRAALQIFDIAPENRANREALARYAADLGSVPDLADRLRAAAEKLKVTDGAQAGAGGTTRAELRRDLLVEVAELHELRLGNAGAAEKVYREILEAEPLHPGAFRALGRLFRDGERWQDLRGLLEERQDRAPDLTEKIDLLAQIAEVDEATLDDSDHAIATYEKMLELDPADPRSYKALDRHYATRERWRDREQLLERRLHFAAEGEVYELEFRRAELRFEKFGDIDGAIEILESIVKANPEHEGARLLLEKALSSPAHRRRAAAVLAPLYEAAESWRPLVTVLGIEREAREGPDAASLLARIAALHESRLSAPLAAMGAWREVLAADPAHKTALSEIERLATKLERWTDLVDVYQEQAFRRDGADLAGRADLLSRAARLYAGRIGNRRSAIDAWKMVLNLDPGNPQTTKPAADALEALYAETGNVAALVKILRMQVGWAETLDARRAVLFRIAEWEETALSDPDAAVATLRTILELDPASTEALDQLERIFERGGQARARVEILRRRIDLAQDAGVRQALWRQIAALLERDVGDLEEAVAANLAILDESPEDLGALDTLARLYEQQGRHADRLEILERRLALVKRDGATRQDVAVRVDILRRIAELSGGPLQNPADALAHWREILTLAPGDPGALAALERMLAGDVGPTLRLGAAEALETMYESAGRFAELAGVLQIYVETETDPRARVATLVRLATLQEGRLSNPESAGRTMALAIRDALGEPQLPLLLDEYERLTGAADQQAEVIALYREIAPDVLDEEVKQHLDRAIAERARRLGDSDLAAESYRRILDRVPDDTAALEALEGIYSDANDSQALYDVLVRQAELASEPAAERRARLRLGALAEEKLNRPEEAITAYERVFELARDATEAIDALDRLYTKEERWVDLVRLIERVLERRMPEAASLALRYRLAEITARRLNDAEAAIEQLRSVLRGDPDHPGAIAMLETMLDDMAVRGIAAELLEPVYAGRQDWASLIRIAEIRLHQVDDPAQRLALTKRIARLYEEQLDDYDTALKWYGKVFQENPTERFNLEQLVRLAGRLGRWREVGTLLSDTLSGSLDDSPAVLDIVRRAAEIFDLRLDSRTEARQFYRRLYQARPDDPETAGLFEAALERWQEWSELRELLDEEAGRATDQQAKKALLHRSARIDEQRLDDPDRALRTLREIIELDPDDRTPPSAADEVERLLRQHEQWQDLADHLEAQLGRATENADRDALALRLAEVFEQKTDNPSAAVERYAEVLERSPAHKDAIEALERLLASPQERARVAAVLEPVYRHAGNWARLVTVLEAQLEDVEDRADRVRLLREVADIQQKLARVDNAFDTRARAWLVDVSGAETLADLEALALSAKLYGPLVQTLQKGADLAGDPDLQSRLWAASADVLERQLGDPGQAIEAWRRALEARPDDVDSFRALERLLTAANRQAELAEVLEKHIEVVTDPVDRKEIGKRIAVLYDQSLKQRDRAIEAWRAVLDVDDGDMDALDALGRLYIANLAWRDLAGVLQRKIELHTNPDNLRLMRLTVARLHDERLSDPQEALGQLRAILDIVPGDTETLEFLDRILVREGQHADLLEILDQRAAIEQDPAARDALAVRAARLLGEELSDVEGSIGRYRDIVSRSPDSPEVREALWRIARGEDFRAAAITALEPLLRAGGEWPQLVELLELKLVVEDSPAARVDILAEIARIQETSLRDPPAAFAAWSRAFAEEVTDTGPREALERLTAAGGDWKALAAVYEDRLGATYDAGLQSWLALRLGGLYEGPLSDPERALEFYRKAAETPGDEGPVLASLERVLGVLERPAELGEVLQRKSEITTDPLQQAEILVQLASVRLRLEDVDGALSALRDALEKSPDHAGARAALRDLLDRPEARDGALDVLEPLAEGRGDYEELAALFEVRLATRDDPAERASWLRRIAEIYEERLDQPDRALDALGRALMDEPVPGETVDALERLAGVVGRPADAARLIEETLTAADPAAAHELALRAARLYEGAPGERAAAERLYARVLADDPENVDALTALEAFYRSSANREALAGVLERRASTEFDPTSRRQRLSEAARIREALGDAASALAAWQTLREAEEGDSEVLTEMARLLEARGQTAELTEVLAERARFENDPSKRASLLMRIGEIRMNTQNDLDGAADAYREALDSTPEDARLLGALEQIEERREDWSTLQEVLLRRMGSVEGALQIPVLLRLAKNAEDKLSDLDQAIGFLHQVLGIDAENATAFQELERLLRANDRWYDLVDVLGKHADVESRAGRQANELALRVAIAEVWEQNLESAESAAEALEKVLEVAPNHVGALLSLARIHETAERWEDATAMLERAAVAVSDPKEAAEIHFRTAQIRRAQGTEGEELEALYIKALETDSTHKPALKALEAMAREAGDHEQLVQLLELHLESTTDVTERRSLLTEIAGIHRDVFDNAASAVPFLEQLAQLSPDDVGVAERLADALTAVGRVDDAGKILQQLVDQLGKARRGKDVARVLQRLGAVAEAKNDRAAAMEHYAAAYKLDPGHAGTLAALGRLAFVSKDLEGARRYFRSLLLQSFDEKAAGITKAGVYLALGLIHLQAGEAPKARNMFERGLEADPKNEELKTALAAMPR